MKLDFEYSGELKSRLQQNAPGTHKAIHLFSSSEGAHSIFHQNEQHRELIERIHALPDIPDERLTSYGEIMEHLVDPLGIDSLEIEDVMARTLASHFRKTYDVSEVGLVDELTVLIARCIPAFLLETASNHPRTGLSEIKSGQVNKYLPLPRKNDYLSLLSS